MKLHLQHTLNTRQWIGLSALGLIGTAFAVTTPTKPTPAVPTPPPTENHSTSPQTRPLHPRPPIPPFNAHTPTPPTKAKIDVSHLTLKGIYHDTTTRWAIIEYQQKQAIYTIGDAVSHPDITLSAINYNSIKLQANNTTYRINVRKPYESNTPLSGGIPIEETEHTTPKELNRFRQAVINNPSKIMELITQPQPILKNGKTQGFQINAGSNTALFEKTGLQTGDIITHINHIPLNTPPTTMTALQKAAEAPVITLNLLRNGTPTTLTIKF